MVRPPPRGRNCYAAAVDLRRRVDEAFAATVAGALDGRELPAPLAPRLSPAVRETLVGAAELCGGECPEVLLDYYTRRMPALWVDQMTAPDPAARLLWRPLDPARLPGLAAALDGLAAALPTLARPLSDRPTLASLYAPTLFGGATPLLGALPSERALIDADLAGGADPDAVIDHRLGGNLVHELCHGRPLDLEAPPPPWMLLESAAVFLGALARPVHIFPERNGEAVPGVSLFVLVGQGLARLAGRDAVLGLLTGGDLPPRLAAPLAVAGWQHWLARRCAPFVIDALDAVAWLKLAALAPAVPDGRPLDLAPRLPSLLDHAVRRPWRELPWWSDEPDTADLEMLATGVDALFQVNRLAPTYQTHPDELPGGAFTIDVEACELRAEPRAHGVFAEPARWVLPPPLARRLHQHGARRIRVETTRAQRALAIQALAEQALANRPLAAETVLSWTSSR